MDNGSEKENIPEVGPANESEGGNSEGDDDDAIDVFITCDLCGMVFGVGENDKALAHEDRCGCFSGGRTLGEVGNNVRVFDHVDELIDFLVQFFETEGRFVDERDGVYFRGSRVGGRQHHSQGGQVGHVAQGGGGGGDAEGGGEVSEVAEEVETGGQGTIEGSNYINLPRIPDWVDYYGPLRQIWEGPREYERVRWDAFRQAEMFDGGLENLRRQ